MVKNVIYQPNTDKTFNVILQVQNAIWCHLVEEKIFKLMNTPPFFQKLYWYYPQDI